MFAENVCGVVVWRTANVVLYHILVEMLIDRVAGTRTDTQVLEIMIL